MIQLRVVSWTRHPKLGGPAPQNPRNLVHSLALVFPIPYSRYYTMAEPDTVTIIRVLIAVFGGTLVYLESDQQLVAARAKEDALRSLLNSRGGAVSPSSSAASNRQRPQMVKKLGEYVIQTMTCRMPAEEFWNLFPWKEALVIFDEPC